MGVSLPRGAKANQGNEAKKKDSEITLRLIVNSHARLMGHLKGTKTAIDLFVIELNDRLQHYIANHG